LIDKHYKRVVKSAFLKNNFIKTRMREEIQIIYLLKVLMIYFDDDDDENKEKDLEIRGWCN